MKPTGQGVIRIRSKQDQAKLDKGGQTSIRWLDKVQQSNERKSEDLSRHKVGHDRGEILQKWEELTGQESMRVEKQVGNKEEMTNAQREKQEEDKGGLKEDKMWKAELMVERERDKSLHSWEMINNLRESLEQKKKTEVESGGFQRSGATMEGHRAPQGVKRDYLLI